jgi:hypothetical protein
LGSLGVGLRGEPEVELGGDKIRVSLDTTGGELVDHYRLGSYVFTTDTTDYVGSTIIH